jgi:forespore regulator of the sigma-K checkpoint
MVNKSSIFPIVLLFLFVLPFLLGTDQKDKKPSWERDPLTLEVVLQTEYLDGNVEEERKKETIWSLQDFWSTYEDWKLMSQTEGMVVFRKKVDDISNKVKQNGYFGIDENNVLSIFNGKPENHEVIKAFYQIDVGKLESYRRDQLKQGIKIDKKATFDTVIKTFKQYALSEPVNE